MWCTFKKKMYAQKVNNVSRGVNAKEGKEGKEGKEEMASTEEEEGTVNG